MLWAMLRMRVGASSTAENAGASDTQAWTCLGNVEKPEDDEGGDRHGEQLALHQREDGQPAARADREAPDLQYDLRPKRSIRNKENRIDGGITKITCTNSENSTGPRPRLWADQRRSEEDDCVDDEVVDHPQQGRREDRPQVAGENLADRACIAPGRGDRRIAADLLHHPRGFHAVATDAREKPRRFGHLSAQVDRQAKRRQPRRRPEQRAIPGRWESAVPSGRG